MKAAVFKAVCPLEIGDTVAVRKTSKAEDGSFEAFYIPDGAGAIVINEPVTVQKVTDIATTHYLKTGETKFSYQLDNSPLYVGMKVLMPVRAYDNELKHRGR